MRAIFSNQPTRAIARAAKAEHRIEECIQRGKSETDLADYEDRYGTAELSKRRYAQGGVRLRRLRKQAAYMTD